MSRNRKIRLLRQHYIRSESQFLTALEGMSTRLVVVPKAARLSALRADLGLIAQDLSAEVDVPLMSSNTSRWFREQKQAPSHVRLNPADATSLNSAERVPFLLMLEVLREDFIFDPDSEQNQDLLSNVLAENGKPKRRLFDSTDAAREAAIRSPQVEYKSESVLEPTSGDVSSGLLLQDLDGGSEKAPTAQAFVLFHRF